MHERCDVVRELIERRSSTTRYEVVNVSLRAMKNTLAEKIHCIRNMLVVREAQREALEEEVRCCLFVFTYLFLLFLLWV